MSNARQAPLHPHTPHAPHASAGRKAPGHRHHAHGPVRLARWQLQAVYASFGLLSASGLLWLALHALALTNASADGMALPSPAKAWAMRVHAASAMLALIALGTVLPVHVCSAWHRRRNRLSGCLNLLVFGVLSLTGYALWYASEGGLKQWSAWLHWGLGVVLPLVLLVHVVWGQRTRA